MEVRTAHGESMYLEPDELVIMLVSASSAYVKSIKQILEVKERVRRKYSRVCRKFLCNLLIEMFDSRKQYL